MSCSELLLSPPTRPESESLPIAPSDIQNMQDGHDDDDYDDDNYIQNLHGDEDDDADDIPKMYDNDDSENGGVNGCFADNGAIVSCPSFLQFPPPLEQKHLILISSCLHRLSVISSASSISSFSVIVFVIVSAFIVASLILLSSSLLSLSLTFRNSLKIRLIGKGKASHRHA